MFIKNLNIYRYNSVIQDIKKGYIVFHISAKLEGASYDSKKYKEIKKNFIKISKKEHKLVFTFEKRRGKSVTLVGRFYLSENEKKDILKILKKALACGGSIKGEWIEFQGDVKSKIKNILQNGGWKFK